MAKNKLQTLADDLEQAMDLCERIEAELDPIKERIEKIRGQIVKELLRMGWKSVNATSGLGFGLVDGKKTFFIKKGMEEKALAWIKEHYPAVLSINKADLNKVLKPLLELPDFFEEKVSEPHLAVRTTEE